MRQTVSFFSIKYQSVKNEFISKTQGCCESNYKCEHQQVISKVRVLILRDFNVVTDRTVEANRTDILLFDKIEHKNHYRLCCSSHIWHKLVLCQYLPKRRGTTSLLLLGWRISLPKIYLQHY